MKGTDRKRYAYVFRYSRRGDSGSLPEKFMGDL
jgi:hypothetical protein